MDKRGIPLVKHEFLPIRQATTKIETIHFEGYMCYPWKLATYNGVKSSTNILLR